MADRPSGPVQPPVIDLTARSESSRPAGEGRAEAGPGSNPRSDAPPRLDVAFGRAYWPLLAAAVAGGAVLGTILTYLVALGLPLPSHQASPPDLAPALAAQGQRLDALSSDVGGVKAAAAKTQADLGAATARLDGGIAALDKAIREIRIALPAPQVPVDLGPLETEIKTLRAQVDAMAAGASGGDAAAIAENLDTLETRVGSLTSRIDGVDSTLSALRTDLDAARQALTEHINASLPSEVGPAVKLPLILTGLQSAFEAGKPFTAELAALHTVIPDLQVPDVLTAAAPAGLSRPDALMQTFEARLPDILAARESPGGDWAQNALDWLKSLLALRPAEEMPGDSPEAVVSRLEGAMSRRDYATASGLVADLPPAMQAAAAPVRDDIAAHAAADRLLAELRGRALSAAETPQ